MRAVLKLIAAGAVIAVCGVAQSIELYAVGGGMLLLLPFAIIATERKPAKPEAITAATTLDVIPLPTPQPPVIARPQPMPAREDDDIEGKTVRAPMSLDEAYEMHARYAPAFDQQVAISRYQAKYGDDHEPVLEPHHQPPSFDQGRYARALQYADAFDEQLTARRRTSAYEVAPPRRIARGSYTPQQYRRVDTRSDQRDWDAKTIVGVPPAKPAK
jgi:hypothetical protein